MTNTNINEISIWENDAPSINLASNQEFYIWVDNAPVVNIDEGWNEEQPITTPIRRRSFIF